MKGTAKNNIAYSGVVRLDIKDSKGRTRKSKVIHNNGVNNLFRLIGALLVGAEPAGVKNTIPNFLSVGSPDVVENTGAMWVSLQSELNLSKRFLLESNKTVFLDNDGVPYVQWSCNIPHSSIGDSEIKEIGLFSGETARVPDLLARIITADETGGIKLAVGESLLVNWQMRFTNKNTNIVGG